MSRASRAKNMETELSSVRLRPTPTRYSADDDDFDDADEDDGTDGAAAYDSDAVDTLCI
jgi:hypothetical protein